MNGWCEGAFGKQRDDGGDYATMREDKMAFMDFKKACFTIDRHGMWQMVRVYGVGGKLLKAVQSFYVDSRSCVLVGMDVSEWFRVNVGLRQGCVISPWMDNVYMDGVVREVKARELG